jgi:hypothetical protein
VIKLVYHFSSRRKIINNIRAQAIVKPAVVKKIEKIIKARNKFAIFFKPFLSSTILMFPGVIKALAVYITAHTIRKPLIHRGKKPGPGAVSDM